MLPHFFPFPDSLCEFLILSRKLSSDHRELYNQNFSSIYPSEESEKKKLTETYFLINIFRYFNQDRYNRLSKIPDRKFYLTIFSHVWWDLISRNILRFYFTSFNIWNKPKLNASARVDLHNFSANYRIYQRCYWDNH